MGGRVAAAEGLAGMCPGGRIFGPRIAAKMCQGIFNQASCRVLNLTCDSEHLDSAQKALESLASDLPMDETSAVSLEPVLGRRAEAIVVPTQAGP